jgi:hypothetical protein
LFLVSRTPYFALNVMPALARRLRATNDALWSMIRKSGSRFSEKIMRY